MPKRLLVAYDGTLQSGRHWRSPSTNGTTRRSRCATSSTPSRQDTAPASASPAVARSGSAGKAGGWGAVREARQPTQGDDW